MAGICSSGYFIFAALYSYIFTLMLHSTTSLVLCVSQGVVLFHSWRTSLDPGPCQPVPEPVSEWTLGWADHLYFPFPETQRPPDVHWVAAGSHRDCGDLVTWMGGQPRGSSCKFITKGNPVRGHWWWTPSFRVADSWKQCKDHRLFKL